MHNVEATLTSPTEPIEFAHKFDRTSFGARFHAYVLCFAGGDTCIRADPITGKAQSS